MMADIILYLDGAQVGDRLFLQSFAAICRRRTASGGILIVHGTGEPAERLLESRGYVAERDGAILRLKEVEEYVLVERATREAGRRVAGALTDAGVSAVQLSGSDRGILRVRTTAGAVEARIDWILALLERDVVPVLALMGNDPATPGAVELDPAAAILAIATAIGRGRCSVRAVVADPRAASPVALESESLRRIASGGIDVRLGDLHSLSDETRKGWNRL